MNDIKIEKTAGGYKAEFEGETVYSMNGEGWLSSNGSVLYDQDEPLRRAFIQQYIDPPTEPEAQPPFKGGDPVVCVSNSLLNSPDLTVGTVYVVDEVRDGYMSVEGVDYWIPPVCFTLAPEPKVHTGDPREWEPGVYRSGNYVVCVDFEGDHFITVLRTASSKEIMVCSTGKTSRSYHRIANSISDIFVDGVMEMEAI